MQLQQIINESNNIVFFGGAGVSTESGIPDFRSVDGLYNQKYDYPPEEILSHTFFNAHTEYFYDFYRDKMLVLDAEPNAAHLKLAELEHAGKLTAVVTQNIDGLHQKAGCKNVFELHGACTEITVQAVISFIMPNILKAVRVFRDVIAVELLNPMLCFMRKVLTIIPLAEQLMLSKMRIA